MTADVETGFPMGMGTKICQNRNGKSTRDSGNGNGYFFMCAKIPIGRLDENEQREQLTIS